MRIVVSGATGFLGSHTVEALLSEGHSVLGIAKHAHDASYPLIAADLGEHGAWQESVKAFKPEVAIHLAWEGIPDYGAEMSERNKDASISFFSFLESIGIERIIGMGTGWEHVKTNAFTAAKGALRECGESLEKKGSLTFVWARIYFAYGPRQRSEALIPSMVRSIKSGIPVQLKTPGAQNDFLYAEDVARALTLLSQSETPGGAYDVGSGVLTPVAEVARLVHEQLGVPFEAQSGAYEAAHVAQTEAMTRLGWTPQVPLPEGVQKTVAWLIKRS